MKSFYDKYKADIFSQNGENGIIDECIRRIGMIPGVAVEFGAPTREYCSNINHLTTWGCRFFDINPSDPYVQKAEITVDNINDLPKCSILSMDTDGADYMLWMAYKGKPDIVIIEINSSLPPMQEHFTYKQGASYITMLKLGIAKGYFLLCHTGNLIFVLDKHRGLFPEVEGDGVSNHSLYFKEDWL